MKLLVTTEIVVICISLVLLFGFVLSNRDIGSSKNGTKVAVGGVTLSVEIARTEAEQNRGLSGRERLAANAGMLFVFQEPRRQAFWMKDMQFPLDLIWIDADLRVVEVTKGAQPCKTNECPAYLPPEPVKYVLEVNSGFCDLQGVKIGDYVDLDI